MTRGRARIGLAVILLAAVAVFGATRIHTRAGIVTIRAVPKVPVPADGDSDGTRVAARDVPPNGVLQQLDYAPAGDAPCPLNSIHDRKPTLVLPDTAVIGGVYAACVSGFPGSDAVELAMRTPHGERRTWRLALSGGWGYREFEPVSRDPVGTYLLTARRGRLHAAAKFVLTVSAQPFMRLRHHHGRTEIVVGGAPPHQPVTLQLYRAWGRRAMAELRRDYYSSLSVATDAQGTAVVDIVPDHGTTFTCYLAALESTDDELSHFCFGKP
jgi:hypothetical protein